MESLTLFHGSNQIVRHPKVLTQGYYKDFGFGFYCTNIEKQAYRWAMTRNNSHVINVFQYLPNEPLKKLTFEKMTESWLDFIVDCRSGKEHDFDIVEGPMADDTIWDYIEDFVNQKISRVAFWELVKFKYPTHQIVFCSDKALQTLTFLRSYQI